MVYDTERRYYVYLWKIKDTGEVFYVGKGTGRRYLTRKRENSFFMKMLNSHDCEAVIYKDNLTEKEAFELEKEIIAYYRQTDCRLTNVQDGGENPPKHHKNKREVVYDVTKDKSAKAVLQCDMQGNVIAEYPSIRIAADSTQCNRTGIIANLKGRSKHAYGYVWKYKHDNAVPSRL